MAGPSGWDGVVTAAFHGRVADGSDESCKYWQLKVPKLPSDDDNELLACIAGDYIAVGLWSHRPVYIQCGVDGTCKDGLAMIYYEEGQGGNATWHLVSKHDKDKIAKADVMRDSSAPPRSGWMFPVDTPHTLAGFTFQPVDKKMATIESVDKKMATIVEDAKPKWSFGAKGQGTIVEAAKPKAEGRVTQKTKRPPPPPPPALGKQHQPHQPPLRPPLAPMAPRQPMGPPSHVDYERDMQRQPPDYKRDMQRAWLDEDEDACVADWWLASGVGDEASSASWHASDKASSASWHASDHESGLSRKESKKQKLCRPRRGGWMTKYMELASAVQEADLEKAKQVMAHHKAAAELG